MKVRIFSAVVAGALASTSLFAGVFIGSNVAGGNSRNNHTYGYAQVDAALTVNICAEASAAGLVAEIQDAIDFWNARTPIENNCAGRCLLHGELAGTGLYYSRKLTLRHELGHCVFGLDESNDGDTSFSALYREPTFTSLTAGTDGVEGSRDDVVSPNPGGARILHWFRVADNDPYVRDGTDMNQTTFTRALSAINALGHKWPANGNREVGKLSYFGLTGRNHALMYGGGSPFTEVLSPIGDEVNMIEFASKGIDELAGGGDDYTVQLAYVSDCGIANVKVRYEPIAGLGLCVNTWTELPVSGQILRHYAAATGVVTINSTPPGQGWAEFFLLDGFEGGDTSRWSATVP